MLAWLAAEVYCAMDLASSVAGSALMPAPGCTQLTTSRPMTSATVVMTSK